jgi:hypothetical protein
MAKKISLLLIFVLILVNGVFSQQNPNDFFGVKIGADRTLIKYPGIIKYFKYLDGASERIKVTDEGKSTLGNSMILAFISSGENIKRLPQLVEINKKLANPDRISKEEAKTLIREGKVFVLITCAIHATEIGATQMSMLFAHQMATTNDPQIKRYLEDVVIVLMPSINPDGNIMVTEWYEKHVGTKYEGARMPYLYHHYAGHDTNRDFFMLNLEESRVVNAVLHHRYFPQIFLDMHQMGSTGTRMFVPPFKDPLNQNLNPLLVRETDIIGSYMSLKLQEEGKQGVASSYSFDAYWPGGSKNTAWYKNVVGLLTELASVKVASPIYVEPNELRVSSKGLPEYKAQVNFPDPWPGGWWRLQDIIDYEMIAVHALLEVSAKNKDSFLSNFYKFGMKNLESGKTSAPYGYLVPAKQWDTPAAYTFLKKMQEGGVRIYRVDKETRFGDRVISEGSFIIPLSQPYGSYVRVMMERQQYPEIKHMREGPIMEPYDASGWTMPLMMGVTSIALNTPLDGLKLTPVESLEYPEIIVRGEGNYYRLPAAYNRSVIAVNRLHKKGINVYRYIGRQKDNGLPGDFLVAVKDIAQKDLETLLKGTGLEVSRMNVDEKQAGATPVLKEIKPPKLAIYQSYAASMDEGWTRWVLDKFEFKYTVLHNKDFLDKKFSQKYDVVIFPDQGRNRIVNGMSSGYYAYYAQSSPPEYKAGIGKNGVEALKQMVGKGGTVILLDSAAELGIKDFALPLSNVMKYAKKGEFYCPGSILKMTVDNTDPIGWGMKKESIIYFSNSAVFRTRVPVLNSIDRKVVAGFAKRGPHLLSGYLKGENLLDRSAMIIRFDYHQGNVIVLGGRIQHRAQTFGTFKFLFNSIYY